MRFDRRRDWMSWKKLFARPYRTVILDVGPGPGDLKRRALLAAKSGLQSHVIRAHARRCRGRACSTASTSF